MRRTAFGSHRPKPKRHPSLVPKALGESAVRKGPVRSKSHLERVREQPCLICGATGVHAHHSRVGLRTMGVRKDDTRAVPLCPVHHDELHKGKEEAFWARYGIRPLDWCTAFTRQRS
jgi:hypothetical protein